MSLFSGIAALTRKDAVLVFSTETLDAESLAGRPFMVGPKQRFAHDIGYIRMALARAGFASAEERAITVRHEEGEPVPGHLVLARRIVKA